MRKNPAVKILLNVLSVLAVTAWTGALQARDIYVDHERGDDDASGKKPLKTIAKAIGLAKPGDTIHLKPTKTQYKESAVFRNRSGEPGRPIVLDGHGATLSGCEPLNPDQWEMVSPGLYRSDKVIKAVPSIVMRYYFIFDGEMNHMGRTSKGPKQPFKKPEELKPGEWTFQKDENAFYVKINPRKTLADCNIEAPVRSSGVAFGGDCSHIVIRNVIATHVWNDGYNIHGKTRDIVFENITAVDCGDDGLSAHEDCEVRVDGFASIGNSTGMCNIGHSTSVSDRVFIKGCLAYGYYMLGSNTHVLANSIIFADGDKSIVVRGGSKPEEVCTVKMDNVVVINGRESPKPISLGRNSVFEGKRLTVYGLGFDVAGISAALTQSVIGGDPAPEIVFRGETKWSADKNVYDLKQFRMNEITYAPSRFAAYQRATSQDRTSKWTTVRFKEPLNGEIKSPKLPKGVGADLSAIPPGPQQKNRKKRRK
jgi:hypothetical protein